MIYIISFAYFEISLGIIIPAIKAIEALLRRLAIPDAIKFVAGFLIITSFTLTVLFVGLIISGLLLSEQTADGQDPTEGVIESLAASFCQDIYKENDAPAIEECALHITVPDNVITVRATRDGNSFKYYDSTIRIGDTITYREDKYDRSGKKLYRPEKRPDTIDTINGKAVVHD